MPNYWLGNDETVKRICRKIIKEELGIKVSNLNTLYALLKDLKYGAYVAGGYPAPYTAERYDIRHTLGKPFRCIRYNRLVRQINALERLLNSIAV